MEPKLPDNDGDTISIAIVNAFGITGVATSLASFFVENRHSIFDINLLGVVIFLAGVATIIYARRALGRNFAIRVRITKEQRLIRSGPYRYIRHPVYLGILLVYFSCPVAYLSVYGALVMIPIVPFLLRRISIEEKAMAVHFGSEYEEYARSTEETDSFRLLNSAKPIACFSRFAQ